MTELTLEDLLHAGTVELVPIASVIEHPRNARRGNIDSIIESIRAHGFLQPLVVQRDTNHVLIGNHRRRALLKIHEEQGIEDGLVPVIFVNVDEEHATKILLADNHTADEATYDDDLLVQLLQEAQATEEGLLGTTYSEDALAELLGATQQSLFPKDEPEPPVPDPPEIPVTKRGDVWILGEHRIMCGDCKHEPDVDALLAGATVAMAFTSPPYADRRHYDKDSGFKPIAPAKYVEWFAPVQEQVARVLAEDGSWFVNLKAAAKGLNTHLYVMDLVIAHVREWGWHFATEYCWERTGIPGRPGRRFRNMFEPIYQFAKADWKFRAKAVRHPSKSAFVYEAGKGKSLPANQGAIGEQWFAEHDSLGAGLAYPGNRLPTFSSTHEAVGHDAAFPIGLPSWFMRAYTDPGDAVFDPFLGSASTTIAAHREGRVSFGMEVSAKSVDVALQRFERATGIVPRLERTGKEVSFVG